MMNLTPKNEDSNNVMLSLARPQTLNLTAEGVTLENIYLSQRLIYVLGLDPVFLYASAICYIVLPNAEAVFSKCILKNKYYFRSF